jgi:hypothetical protein
MKYGLRKPATRGTCFRRLDIVIRGAALILMLLAFCSVQGAAFHPALPDATAGAGPTNEAGLRAALNVKQTGSNTFRIGRVEFDKLERAVSIPARVRVRDQVVEYALVTEQGKAYESLFTTDARPMDIHLAFLLLGTGVAQLTTEPAKPISVPETNTVRIEVTWENNGQLAHHPLADLICLTSGHPDPAAPSMRLEKWFYNGSVFDRAGFSAQREGSIISLIIDPVALINNPGADRSNDDIHFPNIRLLPEEGTPVRILARLATPK